MEYIALSVPGHFAFAAIDSERMYWSFQCRTDISRSWYVIISHVHFSRQCKHVPSVSWVVCLSVMRTYARRLPRARQVARWYITSPHCVLLTLSHSTQNIHNNHPSTTPEHPTPKQEPTHHHPIKKETQPTHYPKMTSNMTDNDRKILAAAWFCFETQPKVSPRQPPLLLRLQASTHPSA